MPADWRQQEQAKAFFARSCVRVCQKLQNCFPAFTVYEQEQSADGPYALWQIPLTEAVELKRFCIALENSLPAGALLDLDLMNDHGEQISREQLGYPPRTCLVCGEQAAVCVRARAHKEEDVSCAIRRLLAQEEAFR